MLSYAPMSARRAAGPLGLLLFAAALTIVMTWPLVPRMASGARLNYGDAEWSIWVVNWVAHALSSQPGTLFQANIFYPERDALAFSEANLGAGALGVPVWIATRNPYATYNSVLLIAFVLSVLSAWALGRYVGASRAAATVSAIAFGFSPFIFARVTHVQLMMIFGMPIALAAMHRLIDRQRVRDAIVLALALAGQSLACAYYGIFAGLAVGLGAFYYSWTRGRWRSLRYWSLQAVAAIIAVALVLPCFLPYVRLQRATGFARSMDDAGQHSAVWGSWLSSAAWTHRWLLPSLENNGEVLFPGVVTIGLGVLGLWYGLARPSQPTLAANAAWITATAERPRETTIFYAIVALLVFWTSFGPAGGFYRLLYATLPVFTFLRAPGRIGVLVTLALVVLGALGLTRWLQRLAPKSRLTVAFAVGAVLVAELFRAPLPLGDAPAVDPAYRLLAQMPRAPVIELPYWHERLAFPRHARYMLMSTYHWLPLVNGYSDHIPAGFRRRARALSTFPSMSAFRMLEPGGVRYAIFHVDHYDERSQARLEEALQRYASYLRPLSKTRDVWLYEIVAFPH
jgi:hypothetical protein